ncbi:ATPase [Sulfolobus sp. A20]|uniref:ABC transporter permease n=1 Tax=Saccharolobus sp. A20 TaxID=1891280 RepID=UPI000863AFD7|nr:ABC transporter permease [Sulfolobus sp. A20]TRM73861.1 ABC transporter permease [Sulfolobus sp. E5]TRM75408.1 ABC transporter permease [Sulfolobus sp. A20-N-F8]TRM83063.1 ABC transporter permease [Sulfolobus sp. A20-N-F6]TRM85518.1 ABC transporter permease [Sulfolobus sp. F3]TRM87795.1 ABC transporter permease [Sulfolobus sp. C3]TRM93769.1 ABC transporter permease [Sulfolobus sp. A20-N-G8]TRN01099.1 ABC transporter permease [Sulfolobus sp. E1]
MADSKRRTFLSKLISNKEFAAIFTLILLWLFFYILNNSFLSLNNLGILFSVIPIYGLVTVGVTLLMIAGEFDLSVAAVFALSPMISALLIAEGFNGYLALFLSLLVSATIGFLNGLITTKGGIPSFIVTLGTLLLWLGITLQLSGGEPHAFPVPISLEKVLVGNIYLDGIINSQLLWFVLISFISTILLERHKWGNWIYAVGGNKDAARAKGINVDLVKISLFILCSLLAGFAGLMQSALYGQVIANQGGNLELDAIAAAVIGGTSLFGGEGSVVGGVIGTIIIWSMENGLILIGVTSYLYETLIGAITIIVVLVYRYSKKMSRNIRLGELNESEE